MDPTVLIPVGFTLLVILMVVIITGNHRNRIEHKSQNVSILGLQVLDEAPSELTRALNRLFQRPTNAPISYDYVFFEREFSADVYLFKINETSGREDTWAGQDVIAILSPHLSLPKLSLAAVPDIDGKPDKQNLVERMLDGVFNWAASRMGLSRLTFPDHHSFNQRFTLFVENEITARHFFTPQRLQSLTGFPANLQVVGSGSVMAVSLLYPPRDSNAADDMKILYRVSKDLFRVFQNED